MTHVANSSEPVQSLEDFEPEEGLDASFLDDTPMTETTNAASVDQRDLDHDSYVNLFFTYFMSVLENLDMSQN